MYQVMVYKILILFALIGLLSCSKGQESPDNEQPPSSLYFPPAGAATWETVTPESLGWNTAAIPALKKLLEDNGTRAFLLLKDGRIVMEDYFGKNLTGLAAFNQNTLWYWASAGKTLTSFAVGKAQEDGFLKLQDKSSNYLGTGWTSLTAQQEAQITVLHQLTMTTGLDDGVPLSHGITPADLKFKAAPGTRWAYHNGPYTLLEKVVANASGKAFETYFKSVLTDKTGMDGTWQWVDSDHVYFSTARSMARFGLLILNKGAWGSEKIMTDSNYFREMVNTSQQLNKSYGYLWWLNGKESFMIPESQIVFPGNLSPAGPVDMVSGIGKNGQYVSIVPSANLVLVRMGENPESVQVPFMFLNDIWIKLNQVIK
jgi:CubicO group peptidase (beta-lactamase class C family)